MIMLNTKFQAWKDREDIAQGRPFNPLNKVRLGFHEVKDSRSIAEMVIDSNNGKGKDQWDRSAVTLMIGVILHIKYAKKDQTIGGLIKFLSKPRRNVMKIVDDMLTTKHDLHGLSNWIDPSTGRPSKTHPIVASIARDLKNKNQDELSIVIDTAISKLKIWPENTLSVELFKEIRHG